ncbi:MAG TPA: serine--tRNA ligase, partial [Bacteroidetes bacterium]|nr:serine--tRNA ligase [Bacteroidota bacterium]HEX05484.1 serine--tRNA ligase [Bacteroidota bacterium]
MHDIKRLRQHADEVKAAIARKGFDADVNSALALDERWRDLTKQGDELKAELNPASKAIGIAKKAGNDAQAEMDKARGIREQAAELDDQKRDLKAELETILLS